MKLCDIQRLLDAEVISGEDKLDTEVDSACASDMMSDVLAFVKSQNLLITGLGNAQVVRTAELMDMKAIVLVRGKSPDVTFIELAKRKQIVVLKTNERMYIACGILYSNGLVLGE